jgi:hypothetical protein
VKITKESFTFILLFCGIALIFICGGIWLWNWQFPALPAENAQWALKASIGQAFGVLSACFAALAFGAALYTIHLQQRQLELQREEVERSRDQLRRAAEAQERSIDALQRQAELLATSARLRALAALLETNLKIKEVRLAEHMQHGPGAGKINFNFQAVENLYNELGDELDKLSGEPVRSPESSDN